MRASCSRNVKSTYDNLAARVAARLAPLLPQGASVLAGLSGGLDSVVLLHLLSRLAPQHGWRLSALHVHHGISPNADAWAAFCTDYCASLAVPLLVERVDIAPLRGELGTEAAARRLRHAAFAGRHAEFVVLAHHADDQAETLLLQLLRGSGVKGVAAMPVFGMRDGMPVVRPLLDLPRAALSAYASEHRLQWVEDESNADVAYPRNFLRHQGLPLLEQRFPACRETLARSARHFADAVELLDDLARIDSVQAIRGDTLGVAELAALSAPRARNLLRYFLHLQGAPMPQTAQLVDMLHQLCEARQDAEICVEYGRWQVRRYRGQAYAVQALPEFERTLVLPWSGEDELAWPALGSVLQFRETLGVGVSLAKLQSAPVTLRLRNGGETLKPRPHAATRSLKNLLQEHAVPPWRRERLPLLYCGDELVSVVGVAIAAEYQAGAAEPGMSIGV